MRELGILKESNQDIIGIEDERKGMSLVLKEFFLKTHYKYQVV